MIDQLQPETINSELLRTLEFDRIGAELRVHSSYEKNGKNARTLVKGKELTITLLALRADCELKEHHAPGPATAIVLEGEIDFRCAAQNKTMNLKKHQSAVFSSSIHHSVKARKDTLLLVIFGQKDD